MDALFSDVESPGVLNATATALAPDRRITLLFSAGDARSVLMTQIALAETQKFRSPVLVITERAEHCALLNTSACAWSVMRTAQGWVPAPAAPPHDPAHPTWAPAPPARRTRRTQGGREK